MPILNWISNPYKHGKSEQELISTAKSKIDVIDDIEVKVDGKDIQGLKEYRFRTDLFAVDLPKNNVLDLPSGPTWLISDGYWLFTEPILNNLTISTFGSCSSGITQIGINYNITVT
jgi:hypothetical protein